VDEMPLDNLCRDKQFLKLKKADVEGLIRKKGLFLEKLRTGHERYNRRIFQKHYLDETALNQGEEGY